MIALRVKRWLLVGLTALAVGVGVFGVAIVQVSRDWAYVCENTGSRKGCREWFSGLRTREWYKESALESFIKQKYPSELEHQWTSYAGTGRNIFGGALVKGHGSPGPIMWLPVDLLSEYASNATPAEMKHLYDTMRRGTDSAKKDIADQVLEAVLQSKEKTEPDGPGHSHRAGQ